MPSTLACVAALDDEEAHALLVNATSAGVTTAIVRGTTLLLHRTVDLQPAATGVPATLPAALFEGREERAVSDRVEAELHRLPLVNAEDSASEWAAQQPLPEHGRNPYATPAAEAESAVQGEDGITNLDAPTYPDRSWQRQSQSTGMEAHWEEAAPVQHSPYTEPDVLAELNAESHNSILLAPTSMRDFAAEAAHAAAAGTLIADEPVHFITQTEPPSLQTEIAEAVNVAAAYFEDTLAQLPGVLFAAGPMGAEKLQQILTDAGEGALRVRELVTTEALLAEAATSSVPRAWLSGVCGALQS